MEKTEKKNTADTSQESKDIVEKEFISFPDIAADVINVLLYQGNEITTAESLLDGPTETVYQGAGRLRNQLEDLCKYEMADGKVSIMYLIANQSKVDKKMLLRKAGYVGGAYREQYDSSADAFPVIEFVLHWGSARWEDNRDTWSLFEGWHFPKEKWEYVDKMKLHLFEMRYLPERVRKLFKSDMRIVVDYLAEGDGYRSDRKIVHKAALIKIIKALSGEKATDEEVNNWLEECQIKEEDEVTVCELFDQYERKGKTQGKIEGKVEDILELLEDYGEIPGKIRERIFGEKDLAVLKRWHKTAAKAGSIEEFQRAM